MCETQNVVFRNAMGYPFNVDGLEAAPIRQIMCLESGNTVEHKKIMRC